MTKYVELSDTEILLDAYGKKTIIIKISTPDVMLDGVLFCGIKFTGDKKMFKDKHMNDMDIKNRI